MNEPDNLEPAPDSVRDETDRLLMEDEVIDFMECDAEFDSVTP
jgi:hypothetical protein